MPCVSSRLCRLREFDIRRFCSIRRNSLLYEEIMIHHPKRHLSALYFLQMGFYDGVKCMMLMEITTYLCCSDSHSLECQPFAHSFLSVRANLNSYLPTIPPKTLLMKPVLSVWGYILIYK